MFGESLSEHSPEQTQVKSDSLLQKIKNTIDSLRLKMQKHRRVSQERASLIEVENVFGAVRVDHAVEQELYALLAESGIQDWQSVRIRQLSSPVMRLIGTKNACVIEVDGIKYLYVNQAWFVTLSEQQKRFIVFHEASHLLLGHYRTRSLVRNSLILGVAVTIGAAGRLFGQCLQQALTQDHIDRKYFLMGTILSGVSTATGIVAALVVPYVVRKQEFEADAHAVKLSKETQGARELFNQWKEDERLCDLEFPQTEELISLRKQIKQIQKKFQSHPDYDERLAAIDTVFNQLRIDLA